MAAPTTTVRASMAGSVPAGAGARAQLAHERALGPVAWLAMASAAGVCVAGFWNVRFVDGLGVAVFVSPTIGAFEGLAGRYHELGAGFGFVFALAAGLAATWTASNFAGLAMLPVLLCAARGRFSLALRMAAITAGSAALVGAIYGVFIGRLGPEGAAAFNVQPIRGAQSLAVFSTLGACMILWAAIEADLLRSRVSFITRAFFAQPGTKAVIAGLMVGAFSMGRPLAVFREFLLYAAQPGRTGYGAAATSVEALGTVLVLLIVFLAVTTFFGPRIGKWLDGTAQQSALVSAAALAAGGAFLIFYWGISRFWPVLGRWGFKLGIYG